MIFEFTDWRETSYATVAIGGKGATVYINRYTQTDPRALMIDGKLNQLMINAVTHELGHALGGLYDTYKDKPDWANWNQWAWEGKYGKLETRKNKKTGKTEYHVEYKDADGNWTKDWITADKFDSATYRPILVKGTPHSIMDAGYADRKVYTFDILRMLQGYFGAPLF